MKSLLRWAIVVVFWCGPHLTLGGEGQLSIRWVEASNQGQSNDVRLADVTAMLRAQLPFTQFRLIDSHSVVLPAHLTTGLARGYSLKCHGPQAQLAVEVRHDKTDVLKTTVALKVGKPLILGGFPAGEGKLILILRAE